MNLLFSNVGKFESKQLLLNQLIVCWEDERCFVNKMLAASFDDSASPNICAKNGLTKNKN